MSWYLWRCRNKGEEMKSLVFISIWWYGKCSIWLLVILFHFLLSFLDSLLSTSLSFGFNLPFLCCILDSWFFTLSDSQQRTLLSSIIMGIFSLLTAIHDNLEIGYHSSFLSFWFIYADLCLNTWQVLRTNISENINYL